MATTQASGNAESGPSNIITSGVVSSLDTAAVFEMLGLMKGSLATIGQQSQMLNEQSAKVAALGPNKDTLRQQAKGIEDEMKRLQEERKKGIENIKGMLKGELKEKIAKGMRKHIEEQIKVQVGEQVKARVAVQIRQHLPVSLEDQVKESRQQINEVKHAFQNSEARSKNSGLKIYLLDEPLAKVLKPDGTPSELYPPNLRSLFAYSPAQARELATEYKLGANGDREKNINRFMMHVGVSFPLLWVSVPGARPGGSTTKTPVAANGAA